MCSIREFNGKGKKHICFIDIYFLFSPLKWGQYTMEESCMHSSKTLICHLRNQCWINKAGGWEPQEQNFQISEFSSFTLRPRIINSYIRIRFKIIFLILIIEIKQPKQYIYVLEIIFSEEFKFYHTRKMLLISAIISNNCIKKVWNLWLNNIFL